MAMRHLRRLQEQAAAKSAPANPEPEEDDEEEEEDEPVGGKAPFNPFDLLSDDDDEPAAEEEEEEKAEEPGQLPTKPAAAAAPAPAAGSSSKKSKNKKKKGKSGGGKGQAADSEDEGTASGGKGAGKASGKGAAAAAAAPAASASVEDDIDAIVRELNLTTVGAAASTSGAGAGGARAASGAPSVLCVDVKGLRGDDELRRIFGSDVVAAVDRQDRAQAAEQRRYGNAARGLPGARRRGLALKKGWLVAPKEHWPPSEGGLSMELAGHKGGVPLFKYTHSPAYRDTQARFYRCQASYDPATIAALLQQAPYHVDSLLAMHDLYRHMGENSYAEEMLDRALWALEAAWHPGFTPASAACRLDYGAEENRPLFGALFRHVQALSRRGCHRAALECCKLLLALEPEDPLGALYLTDYLAVRAGRYDWLQRFVLQFEGNRSLALLPNYAFALPMAAHRRQQEQPQPQQAAGGGSSGSKSAAAAERAQPGASSSSGGGGSASDLSASSPHELLVGALLLHPLVLPRLIAKLQDKGALGAKESWWKELLGRKLFATAGDGGSASLSHLVGLYVERSGELWKPPDLLALLRAAASEAADVADGKRAPSNGITAADWAALARESFPAKAANEYGHLRLADFSDAVNALPREEVEAAVQGGGAMVDVEEQLAELQEQMILAAQQRQAAGANGGGGAPAMTDEELRGANPLLLLLRSMLPWVNAGQQPDYAAGPEAAAAGAGAGAARGAAAAAGAGAGAAVAAPPPAPLPEYDDEDGHLSDEEGVVRQVRR